MKRTTTKNLYGSFAGVATNYVTTQLANTRLIGAHLSVYGTFAAHSYGQVWLARGTTATIQAATSGIENGILANVFTAGQENIAQQDVSSIWIPLNIFFSYPDTITMGIYVSAAAATVVASCVLHLESP